MIDWLRTSKSAYFHQKRKRLPKAAVVDLFRTIRQNSEGPSNNIFLHIKEPLGHALWSAVSFFYDRDPAFLDLPQHHDRERVCGFLFLVEHRDHIVTFKANLDIPSDFKTEYLRRAGDDKVEAAIAQADATFEQIRLKNMATSRHALRFKTLEAEDLQNVVGPSGASRFVPRGYRVRRREGDRYTATPRTGRISLRSDRTGYEELVRWAVLVIDMLIDEDAAASTFMRAFARPIDLESIPDAVTPTYIALDVAALTDELFQEPNAMQLIRRAGNEDSILDRAQAEALLAAIGRTLPIRTVKGELKIFEVRDDVQVGTISIGKTRISLRTFTIPEIEDIYIERVNPDAGEAEPIPIKRYIDQNDLFTILFNNVAIAYLDGALYKDESLADGRQFLAHVRTENRLRAATSEKGAFTPQHRTFDANSIFGIVIDRVASSDEILICDDLGDEWADFIGINASTQPKTISFYHAKHDALSLGASPLHALVSQAIKNLGRINLGQEEIEAKLTKWMTNYNNDRVETAIPRFVRGDPATVMDRINEVVASPDTIRRVFIVTSSLSRKQLDDTFVTIRAGEAATPYFVQLYWLLMSYFSACSEVGAYAYVVCQT